MENYKTWKPPPQNPLAVAFIVIIKSRCFTVHGAPVAQFIPHAVLITSKTSGRDFKNYTVNSGNLIPDECGISLALIGGEDVHHELCVAFSVDP